MGTQYHCDRERRRQAIDNTTGLNGIDYLEVLHLEAPAGSPLQQTLMVRFLDSLPAGLDADNVMIVGGVRITPVGVEWAARASDANILLADGLINTAERDFFVALTDADALLLVRTDSPGDYSSYRFCFVSSPTNPEPPAGFDPVASQVTFSFKVECPSEFDCATEMQCPESPFEAPVLDYLAKDYASFRQLMLDRLSVILPDWQERNPADLGIALVEALAWAGDHLSYFQDAAATESYLGTARRRSSLRRHARLLDYDMHDGCNARAWVAFQVDSGGDGAVLPQRDAVGRPTRLLTRLPYSTRIAEDQLPEVLSMHRVEVFELMENLRLYEAHNTIEFWTWGDEACCLPAGATQAVLKDKTSERLRLREGDVLVFEEHIHPGTGDPQDADPAHRHAVRLIEVTPQASVDPAGQRTPGALLTDPAFSDQPIVRIRWTAADALPFPLCLSAVIDGIPHADMSVALGNVALADHGQSLPDPELLPSVPSFGRLRYRPRLSRSGITFAEPLDQQKNGQPPAASAVLLQDPRKALPVVELLSPGEVWSPQRDLLNSDRFAAEFVVEMESDGHGVLRFGDGLFGKQPSRDDPLQARYRIGNGSAGNVGAGGIHHVVTDASGITGVSNPLAATGGTDPESLDEVRLYAPQAFRTQERAVTEADYAEVTERHPQVQQAVATRRWTGSWYTQFITVDAAGGRKVDAAFETETRRFVERYRLAGHDLEIDDPRFVPLDIVFTVCVEAEYFRTGVKQALFEVFSNRDRSDGSRGFFHPDRFSFGDAVYLSEMIAAAMAVPGVKWVDVDAERGDRFQRWGRAAQDEIADGHIEMGRLEIARLDNDPSQQENGKIDFNMEGGL